MCSLLFALQMMCIYRTHTESRGNGKNDGGFTLQPFSFLIRHYRVLLLSTHTCIVYLCVLEDGFLHFFFSFPEDFSCGGFLWNFFFLFWINGLMFTLYSFPRQICDLIKLAQLHGIKALRWSLHLQRQPLERRLTLCNLHLLYLTNYYVTVLNVIQM